MLSLVLESAVRDFCKYLREGRCTFYTGQTNVRSKRNKKDGKTIGLGLFCDRLRSGF